MGALSLPTAGPVYLDTAPVIYSMEHIAPYDALLLPVWQAASSGRFRLVSSEILLLESLVKPFQI